MADGLANCYMVVPGGSVIIPITRAITIGGLPASNTAKVETLWDDNNVISSNPTLSGTGASRTINVRASNNHGNAVIALMDATGTIRWSWHIWVTDYTGVATWTNPNNTAYTFMDRNLGATDNQLNLASRGLFYQWGRKDPFPGGKAGTAGHAALSHFRGMTDAGSTTAEYVTYTSVDAAGIAAGIMASIQHPTTFYSEVMDGNWLPAVDKTLWNTTEGRKSVYDPCPTGWRVPRGGSTPADDPWYGLISVGWRETDTGGITLGLYATYPAAGCRSSSNGYAAPDDNISQWIAYRDGYSFYFLRIYKSHQYIGISTSMNGFANSIRCVKE
jgi:hypothetical protein